MYYSEHFKSPISKANVMRYFGVDPENDAATALQAGIYPVIDCEDGYSPTHYVKEGQAYRAVPHEFSDSERNAVYQVRAAKMSLEEAVEKLKLPQTTDLVTETASD